MEHCEEFELLLHESRIALERHDQEWLDLIEAEMRLHTEKHMEGIAKDWEQR